MTMTKNKNKLIFCKKKVLILISRDEIVKYWNIFFNKFQKIKNSGRNDAVSTSFLNLNNLNLKKTTKI